MKIVVTGGSGLIGTKLVRLLRDDGHEVLPTSPSTGVNTLTGEGLAEALAGAAVVVDVANSPSFEDRAVLEFFETAGRNIHAAERTAGTRHHVALSVVGTDRLPASGYFRAKLAQENLIKAAGVRSRADGANQLCHTCFKKALFYRGVPLCHVLRNDRGGWQSWSSITVRGDQPDSSAASRFVPPSPSTGRD